MALDGGLPGGFTVASVEEDLGGGDAVVLVGIVASLRDVVHNVEQVATVVGTREDLVGESTSWDGWELLGRGGHRYLEIRIRYVCMCCQV